MNYFSGVYIPDTTSGLLGGHCVKIVGWGEDAGMGCCSVRLHCASWLLRLRLLASDAACVHARITGVPYWTVANSWGTLWGRPAALWHFLSRDAVYRRKRLLQDPSRTERLRVRGWSSCWHAGHLSATSFARATPAALVKCDHASVTNVPPKLLRTQQHAQIKARSHCGCHTTHCFSFCLPSFQQIMIGQASSTQDSA
jgi:hypothetical protein